MKTIYALVDLSRQAHHQRLARQRRQARRRQLYIHLIEQVREWHPRMGLVAIYHLTKPLGIGRQAFVALGKQEGFLLDQPKSFLRTTRSVRSCSYGNLLVHRRFTGVNQLWSADITYFQAEGQTYYLFFLMDVYSRRILGWRASTNMQATNNLAALRMALGHRRGEDLEGLVHHSDRGSQYNAEAYTRLLQRHAIRISMCGSALENAHIERVHGTIKNDYLCHWENGSLTQVRRNLNKAVKAYNEKRPHRSLGGKTPLAYEQDLKQIPKSQRTKMKIFVSKKAKRQTIMENQLVLFF